ncbi:MAG: hypothetical protein QXW35_00275 [Candidatus Aenigmatarchaeota archaeon]
MKFQAEIISYLSFVLIIFIILSFLIYYFYFLSDFISKNFNKLNMYSVLNIFESPILIFNSACDYCKVSYIININTSFRTHNFLILISSDSSKIKYEELFSSSVISSGLFNYSKKFVYDIYAASTKRIFFEFNKINNVITIKNI